MTVIDLYPRLLTGPTENNMMVTDLYPRLLAGPTEDNMTVIDLYPRLMTCPTEDNMMVTHPLNSKNEIEFFWLMYNTTSKMIKLHQGTF